MGFMPTQIEVESLVAELFTLNSGIDRTKRENKAASSLSLLQVVPVDDGIRPSEIAARRQMHQSLVTRQVRELEDAGYLQVTANPADGRSCLVSLTPSGAAELNRLTHAGLDRFGLFVRDWTADEVRTLTALLGKLQRSMARVNAADRPPSGRRWASQRSPSAGLPSNK